jgi:hypothetical protein
MLVTANMTRLINDCVAAGVESGNRKATLGLDIARSGDLEIYPQLIHK